MMNDKSDILLINRDKEFMEGICEQIRHAGHTVHTAMDMREALTAMSSKPVGLIICDNALQDVSGYDFLHYLKSDPLRDSVPFVFFVPLNDQGRASKAFERGAIDFWVYPLGADDLIRRIREIVPTSASTEPIPGQASQPTGPQGGPSLKVEEAPWLEQRKEERSRPLPYIAVEVSRDGIVWLPGQVVNFSRDGVFMKTALLGKDGLTLKIKLTLPSGVAIVSGQIKHIAFSDFQQPTGIGIRMEESPEWKQVHDYLSSVLEKGETSSPEEEGITPSQKAPVSLAKTMVIGDLKEQAPQRIPIPESAPKIAEDSYDLRFYQSLIGKQLDNYKAVSFIGAGTMGGVFKGWDVALERVVAIKVISYELASQETFRDMFIKEARIISKLDHPNIAHIHYIGNTNNILYFVMEFISGQSLKNLIDSRTNLNTLRGLDYLITVCQALDFVSKQNIIHRDIKPENIMVDGKGYLKIVDFGVAKTMDSEAAGVKPEGIVGSPLYISPDCILGRALDHRSDIYSLGASFYHAFTGFPPFDGKNAEEVLLKHLNDPCRPLNEKNPKVSKALGKIIEKMMAKEPEARYQEYAGIIDDLKTLRSRALKFQQMKNATLILRPKNPTKPSR